MKQASLPYEQLHLPGSNPADQSVAPEASHAIGLTDEEERLWDLQDSKAESHNIIERRMHAGKIATSHAVEPVSDDEPKEPAKSVKSRRRPSARAQAWGETTPADDGAWSNLG